MTRSLLLPLHPTTLMFVACNSILLTLAFSIGGLLVIPAGYFLGSWLFKYAYVLLEHVADGRPEPPVASAEMLGPFELRPMVQLLVCLLVYRLAQWLGGTPRIIVLLVGLALLPVSIGVLGAFGTPWATFNPLVLWRTWRALGAHYFAVAAVMATFSLLLWLLWRAQAWSLWFWLGAEYAVLATFCTIGAAMYQRRAAIGIEPVHSPERIAARARGERSRARTRMLDEVYVQVRARQFRRCPAALRQWLANMDESWAEDDMRDILASLARWAEPRATRELAPVIIEELLRGGRTPLARQALATLQGILPDYIPEASVAERLLELTNAGSPPAPARPPESPSR